MSSPEAAEYKLIVQANNTAVEIENEVLIVQKVGRRTRSCAQDRHASSHA